MSNWPQNVDTLPLHHQFELVAPFLQFFELRLAFYNRRIVGQWNVGFPTVTGNACCDEIYNIVLAAASDRINVIDVQQYVGRFRTAVLTREFIALEDLETKALWDRDTLRFGDPSVRNVLNVFGASSNPPILSTINRRIPVRARHFPASSIRR